MVKKNVWKIELKLLSRFLNVLANNDFKWRDGERIADFKPFCFDEIILLVEESPKVISYTEYFFHNITAKKEYNVIEVTEETLRGMESVLQGHTLRDNGGVFKPKNGQEYWYIIDGNTVRSQWWNDLLVNHDYYEIGNCFPSRESAKDTVRALKLIQKARESQDGFAPDWDDETQYKYSLRLKFGDIGIENYRLTNAASALGYWRDKSVCDKFVTDNHHELTWFFKEYQR